MGYSFSDENIDLIFSKHQELYGTSLLPKSYIIAFKDKFNEERAAVLAKKNIVTIVLDSVKELEELISELNKSVFRKDISRQTKDIFKSHPLEVLLKSDLSNLKDYLKDSSKSEDQKAKKFREVLELKEFSEAIENQVKEFLLELIKSETSIELKKAIVHSFHHIAFKKAESALLVGAELISFTKYEDLNYNIQTGSSTDVMSEIESKLTPVPTCLAIFLFLFSAIKNEEKLSEDQLRRVFEMLHDCEWENIGNVSEAFSKEFQKEIINHYLSQFPGLSRQLYEKPMIGKRRTRSQIAKDIQEMMGKNMKGLLDD